MTPPDGRGEYIKRMHHALEYIDKNLDRSPDLAELAGVAHFSTFHFHRVFSAWLGETFGEYVRRRRLEVAASRLVGQPRVPVLSVALSVGFGSTEAFCRAFKARFGYTPSEWRKREAMARSQSGVTSTKDRPTLDSNPDQLLRKGNQASQDRRLQHNASDQPAPETAMKVSVIDRQTVRVAYLRHVGPYGEPLARFWQDVAYPWMLSNGLLGRPRYGVSHDDPGITVAEKCRYDAAVEITGPLAAPGQGMITTIPGGKYAVTHFRGTAAQIGAVWVELLRDWLPSSGLQLDARPFFEYYGSDSGFDPQTGIFTCDLAIPVAPL